MQPEPTDSRSSPAEPEKKPSRWPFWLRDLFFAGLIFWAISAWRNADLIEVGKPAPDFSLTALDGTEHSLRAKAGKPIVLYFFAPWCKVCSATAHNVRALREEEPTADLTVYAVALSYGAPESVGRFAQDHQLDNLPVLLGDDSMLERWNIRAFPTFYIVDSTGKVSSRTVGYTTEVGLRARLAAGL